MHEFALAEAVVEAALVEARKAGMEQIESLVVRVGELQKIERELFAFALKEVLPASESRLAGTRIEVETEAARFRCRPCGEEFSLADTGGPKDEDESEAIHFIPELAHAYLRCPACRSPDFEVTAGRGVVLERMEGS